MELIWTALLLGLIGSVHCAGMCGPLAIAVPVLSNSRCSLFTSRLLYNAGRVSTYITLGVLFGTLGKSISLAGWQRWLSISMGIALLLGLLLSLRMSANAPVWKFVALLKRTFANLLRRRTVASLFALGAINGMLPCGLVYVAGASAATTGSPLEGAAHMAAFGLGTLPMMLGLGMAGRKFAGISRWRGLIPTSVAIVGLMLVLRGLALGIPYLSPALDAAHACH
jgi:sulfite exporter TauE/SafE